MDNFEKRLLDSYDNLTKSHKLLAKYLFENMDKAVFLTALQIAKDVDLSETTVIRLAYKLGYDSFSTMHKSMQDIVLANKNLEITNNDREVAKITSSLSEVHNEYLYRTLNNLDNSIFENICDCLMGSEKILVMGYKDSYGASVELMRLLEKIRPKVFFHRWTRDRNDIVYEMAKDSLMIAVSFVPHSRFTVTETEFMKKIGCNIIAITDSAVNPFRHIADYNLVVDLAKDKATGFVNTASALSLFSYINQYIYSKYKNQIDEYLLTSKKYDEDYVQ